MEKHEWSQENEELPAAYKSYIVETSDGKQGKTANYWISYVTIIHLHHEFSKSICTGDLDLFILSLPKISFCSHFKEMKHFQLSLLCFVGI